MMQTADDLIAKVPHDDWCCAKGCAGPGFCGGCGGGENDCRCFRREMKAAIIEAFDAGYEYRISEQWGAI